VKSIALAICLYWCVAGVAGLAQTESPDAYTEAVFAFQRGKLEPAEQKLRVAIAGEPDRPDLLGLLALVLDAKKEYEQAEPFHQRALDLAPQSAGLWNNFGNHYLARGNDAQAGKAFLRVLAIDPGHANANLQLARMALFEKHGAEALRYMENLKPAERSAAPVQLMWARALYAAGQPRAAVAIIDRLEKDPAGDARLAFSLGVILAEWEKYDRAEGAFSRALESDPANIEILHKVGLAAFRAGHLDRAQNVFEIALRQRPADVESLFNLARVQAAKGSNESALVLLAQARRLAPDRADLLAYLARMYAEAGFFSGAADAYEEYLKLQPDDATARRERGFAYCRFGRMQTAMTDLNGYVKNYPRDPVGHFELGLCETLGDESQAFEHLSEALRLKPDFTPAHQARGWLLGREGKWQEALPDVKFVVDREPKNSMALLQMGRICLELDRPADSVVFLRRARELAPEHTGVLKQLHRALRGLGQNDEAAVVLQKLKAADPDRTSLRAKAQIFDYLGLDPAEQRDRFRRNLMQAITASPSDPALRVQLGALLFNEGKTEEALAAFRESLALSPNARVLNEGAAALVEHKQYALAREFLTRVVAADASVENRLDLAAATFHSAGPEASLAEIEKIPFQDRDGDVYLLKAQILDTLGRFEDAVDSLNIGFQRAPKRADLYFWASLFLIKHNRDQQALELLEAATRIVPDDPDLLVTKATVMELRRKTEEADVLLKKIQLRWPEWGRSYLIRGIIQSIHRNPEEALRSIRTAIALGETTPQAYYYLADTTRTARPEDAEAARQAIEEAIRLDPNDAWFHALAGKIALETKQPGKAVEQSKEAIRLRPDLVEAHYSLSIAYKKLGMQDEAATEVDVVRRLREQNPQAEQEPTGIRQVLFPVRNSSIAAPPSAPR
jgi:tetratricopeptide (TPR) repeat protein